VKRKLQVIKRKITSITSEIFEEVCRWKTDQRATTLFRWRCDRL